MDSKWPWMLDSNSYFLISTSHQPSIVTFMSILTIPARNNELIHPGILRRKLKVMDKHGYFNYLGWISNVI